MIGFILLIQPLVLLMHILIVRRFSLLISSPPAQFIPTFKAVTLSAGLNNIIPGRISELLKITYMQEKAGVSLSAGFSAVLMSKFIDLIIVTLLSVISIGLIFKKGVFTIPVIAAISFAFIMLPFYEKYILKAASRIPLLNIYLKEFLDHTSKKIREGYFYKGLMLGIMNCMINYFCVFILLNSLGSIEVGHVEAIKIFTAISIGSAVPILPGGLGTYEAAGILVLKSIGYGVEEALSITLAIHFGQVILLIILSFYIAASEGTGLSCFLLKIYNMVKLRKAD